MHRLAYAALAGAFPLMLAAAPALAASPFDGTWKVDLKTVDPGKRPDVFAVKDGMFNCSSCIPAVKIKADGAFHAVQDHPGYDELAIKVVDAHTLQRTAKRGGRVVSGATDTVSADGKTLEAKFSSAQNVGAKAITGDQKFTRVGPAPAGAHAASGSWQATMEGAKSSDSGLLTTFRMEGDTLHMTTPDGTAYAAKVGGAPAKITGAPGVDMTTVKKVSDHELIETDTLEGKVITVYHMTVSADGKTMTTIVDDKKYGTTSSAKATKV